MRYIDGVLHIGSFSSVELVRRFGSPLYVYDAAVIRRQIDRIRAAFSGLPLQPFYAAKANSNLSLLHLIARSGFGCDAVSPGEVFLAAKAGFPSAKIWFTCSNVSDDDLRSINDSAIIINLNAMSELRRCIRLNVRNRVAIRINPEVGAGHHRDVVTGGFGVKFGFDVAELDDVRLMTGDAGLQIVGLHAHIGSGISAMEPMIASATRLVDLSDQFDGLEWLNFGGGLSIPYAPHEQEFPIDDYGAALAESVGDVLRRRKITGILEPGRYVVAQSAALLTTVTAKRMTAGREWIGCDTGFNHMTRPSRYGSYHHILNASRGSERWLRENFVQTETDEQVVIAGNLCESGDVFTRDIDGVRPRPMPRVSEGDLLAICDVGAYGFSMASIYNERLLPPEVLVDGEEVRLIRQRQTFSDLLRGQ